MSQSVRLLLGKLTTSCRINPQFINQITGCSKVMEKCSHNESKLLVGCQIPARPLHFDLSPLGTEKQCKCDPAWRKMGTACFCILTWSSIVKCFVTPLKVQSKYMEPSHISLVLSKYILTSNYNKYFFPTE